MKSYALTDRGQVRSMNQDYIFCSETPVGNLPNLLVVADGMGGHKAGDLASRCCVENLEKQVQLSSLATPVSILGEAIEKANSAVYEKAGESLDYEGMGTTLVAAVVTNNILYVANIGDSRLYVIKDRIKQITSDHSWVEEMVKKGELREEETRFHPNKNIITRAIGTGPEVTADFFELELKEGSRILLCSDGLSNMLEDEEIFDIVKHREENLEAIGKRLIDRANENGGKDNISVVLAEI